MTMPRRIALACAAAAALAFAPRPGAAQQQPAAWPARPVSIVVAFAPGGAADIIARILAQRLSEQVGQPFVVENRVGGGGTVSAAYVAQSRPDGQTVLLLTSGHAVNETLNRNRGYDLLRDLRPVAGFAATPYWLVTTAGKASSLRDLLQRARREPLTFASGGPGGLAHLLGEMLKQETKLDLIHVPYRGNAPAINDLVAGRVTLVIELKSRFDGDRRLVTRAGEVLSGYSGPVAVMSFDPAHISHLRAIAPGLTRGLVAERHRRDEGKPFWTSAERALAYIPQALRSRLQFLAYSVKDLPSAVPLAVRNVLGLPLLTWTVRTDGDRQRAGRWADQIIFEGFRP